MTGIENEIRFSESPRIVYKHLANPHNIPLFAPGIRDATITGWVPDGVGTRVSLKTRGNHRREAYVTEESERKFIAIQDDHGTLNEWELRRAPDGGTVAVNRIIGTFTPDRATRLRSEARVKLFAFKDIVDASRQAARDGARRMP